MAPNDGTSALRLGRVASAPARLPRRRVRRTDRRRQPIAGAVDAREVLQLRCSPTEVPLQRALAWRQRRTYGVGGEAAQQPVTPALERQVEDRSVGVVVGAVEVVHVPNGTDPPRRAAVPAA